MNLVIAPREWRLDGKMTLAKAASLAGVAGKNPSRTWQRWESGELEPPLNVVVLIESASNGRVCVASWRRVRQQFLSKRSDKSGTATAAPELIEAR